MNCSAAPDDSSKSTLKSHKANKTETTDKINNYCSIYYQNVQGLNTKTHQFLNAVYSCDYSTICCSETWLQNNVSNNEIFSKDYTVFRSARNLTALQYTRGGGVLIGVRYTLNSSEINLTFIKHDLPAIDIIGVKIMLNKSRLLYLFVLYIPPGTAVDTYNLLFEHLESLQFIF